MPSSFSASRRSIGRLPLPGLALSLATGLVLLAAHGPRPGGEAGPALGLMTGSDAAGLVARAPTPAPPVLADASGGAVRGEDTRPLRRTPVVDVFEARRDAVVNIATTEVDEVRVRGGSRLDSFFDDFFDMPRRTPRSPRTRTFTRRSVGSGFVLHPDGYIVTNAHVVSRSAAEQKVIFADGNEYDARIVATDRAADLAILKIEADRPLPVLPLGRSDDLMIGETVIAIGNPLGFQHTVTAGVVSAIGRSIEIERGLAFDDLIQTDASINPGNSGGPLLNVLGELIGVNTAIRGDAQNIGFAISVDRLRAALPRLLDVERRYRIDTGLRLDPFGPPRVAAVEPDGPAARAGLRPGDRILTIDGEPVGRAIDVHIALMGRLAGETLPIRLARTAAADGQPDREERVRLRLAERPRPDGAALADALLGIRVEELPEDVARRLDLRRDGGVAIAAVDADGPAGRAGIERLDILLAVGEVYVAGLDDLGRLLERTRPGTELPVRILRIDRGRLVVLNGSVRTRD